MFVILLMTSTIILTSALKPASKVEFAESKIKNIINKYIANISDIEDQYIVDERISRAISHYFHGKLSAFPLFKIRLKIDRTPVKIPWTLEDEQTKTDEAQRNVQQQQKTHVIKRYKRKKHVKPNQIGKLSDKPGRSRNIVTAKVAEKKGENEDINSANISEKRGENKVILANITQKRSENRETNTAEKLGENKINTSNIAEKHDKNNDINTANITEKLGENKVIGTSTEKPGGYKDMRTEKSSGKPEKN